MFARTFDHPFEVVIISSDGSPIQCAQQSSSHELRVSVKSRVTVLIQQPPIRTNRCSNSPDHSINGVTRPEFPIHSASEAHHSIAPTSPIADQRKSCPSGICSPVHETDTQVTSFNQDNLNKLTLPIPSHSSCGESDAETTSSSDVLDRASAAPRGDTLPIKEQQCESDSESFVILDSEPATFPDSLDLKNDEKIRPNAFDRFKKIGLTSIFKSFRSNFRNQPDALSKNSETIQSDTESGFNSDEEKLEVPSKTLTEKVQYASNEDSVNERPDAPINSEIEGHGKDKSTNECVGDSNDQLMELAENADEAEDEQLIDCVKLSENKTKRKISLVNLVPSEDNPDPVPVAIGGSSGHQSEEQQNKKLKKSLSDADKLILTEKIESEVNGQTVNKETGPEDQDTSSGFSQSESVKVYLSSNDQGQSTDESPSQSPNNVEDSGDESKEMNSVGLTSVCRNDNERTRTSESGSSSSSCDNLIKKRRAVNGFNVNGLTRRAAFTVIVIEKGWKQDGDRSHAIFQNIYKDFGRHQDKILEIVIEKNCIKVYTDHRNTRLLLMQELKEINAIINETSTFQLDVQNPLKPSIQFLVQDTIYNLSCSEFLSLLRTWNDWDDEWTVHIESKEWIRKIRKGKISLIVDARIRDKLEAQDLIIKIDQVPVKVFDKFGIIQCSVCLRFGHAKCRTRIRCFFCSGFHPDKIRHDKYTEQRYCFLCRTSGHTPIAKNCPSLIAEIQSKLELIDYEYSDIFLGNDRSY